MLSHCSKDEEIQLKECAGSSMAGILIGRRRRILHRHPIEILNHLNQIERHRDLLMNIDDLHPQCQQLIETMHGLGLLV